MKLRRYFLIGLLSIGFFKCTEEDINHSLPSSLQGEWQISWSYDKEVLEGRINFAGERATIAAFGSSASGLLSDFDKATYAVTLSDEKLILKNEVSGIELIYNIQQKETDRWEMLYLNDISVVLARK